MISLNPFITIQVVIYLKVIFFRITGDNLNLERNGQIFVWLQLLNSYPEENH